MRVGQDVSRIPGLRPLDVSSKPLPSCDNQKCLQTLPSAPSGGERVKLSQVDVSLMCQYFMSGVHKGRCKSHDPSGEGSAWGAAALDGPAFCSRSLSILPAGCWCAFKCRIRHFRDERLRRHWPQEPSRNSFALGLLRAAVFHVPVDICATPSRAGALQVVRTLHCLQG